MSLLLTWIWRDIPAYERKINLNIEETSKEIEVSDKIIETIIDKINNKNWATSMEDLLNQIKVYCTENDEINIKEIMKFFEKKRKETFQPDIEKMEWILEWNILNLLGYLLKWNVIDKSSSKIVKELIIHIVLLKWFEGKEKSKKTAESNISDFSVNTSGKIQEILK